MRLTRTPTLAIGFGAFALGISIGSVAPGGVAPAGWVFGPLLIAIGVSDILIRRNQAKNLEVAA